MSKVQTAGAYPISRSIATPPLDGMLASPLLGYTVAVCHRYASNTPG